MPTQPRPDHLAYALRLHTVLHAEARNGLVWSPYSVAAALGLIAAGSGGRTREEFTALLGGDIDAHLAALDDAVTGDDGLASATGLWVRSDLPLHPEFEARLRARPDSGVHPADFEHDPEGVRRTVNTEVAKVTRGMIEELLEPGWVAPTFQALLVNALWMRLQWESPFAAERTAPLDFHAPGGTRRVPAMHKDAKLPYAEWDGWRMVSLAGQGGLVLDVLLPDRGAADLTPAVLGALHRAASARDEVRLALPRFELTGRVELAGPLAETGVRTVFSDAADLSGISPRPLAVDRVIHQAVLKVDEKGAEGAAATAVGMRLAMAPVKPRVITFTVDRPFTVVVRRRAAILFLGEVAAPEDPGPAQ
ncbi:serpin B [Murinocardiopsis flavida]|uniref:Serpin B n=1 Tax=Murinocardiopsis flavida TaxID=645275 RepID=A0A2P8CH15_9ACTN|nr:serpin family protein [Murinocardiopsis flavida]PSK84199.1 serpin B [Murinocardiopsis flavida]